MIKKLFNKQTLKYNGMYRGKVVDTSDPKAMGRIRIRVYGVMSKTTIQTEALPWAVPAAPLSTGSAVGSGSFYIPQVDSEVFVFFEDGNPMSPVYFAEAHNGVKGLPAFKDVNYPYTVGTRLKGGMEAYADIENLTFRMQHPKGTTLEALNTGDVNLNIIKDFLSLVGNDLVNAVGRDYIMDVARNYYVSVYNESSIWDIHDERLVPPGTGPIPTLLSNAPAGWIFMYGQNLSKSDGEKFRTLFGILANVYPNSGQSFDSGSPIIVPDMRGRVPVGLDNIGGTRLNIIDLAEAIVMGQKTGEQRHQLTIPELARHQHFGYGEAFTGIWPYGTSGGPNNYGSASTDQDNRLYGTTFEGQDVPHNNVQPTLFVNMMIKY